MAYNTTAAQVYLESANAIANRYLPNEVKLILFKNSFQVNFLTNALCTLAYLS